MKHCKYVYYYKLRQLYSEAFKVLSRYDYYDRYAEITMRQPNFSQIMKDYCDNNNQLVNTKDMLDGIYPAEIMDYSSRWPDRIRHDIAEKYSIILIPPTLDLTHIEGDIINNIIIYGKNIRSVSTKTGDCIVHKKYYLGNRSNIVRYVPMENTLGGIPIVGLVEYVCRILSIDADEVRTILTKHVFLTDDMRRCLIRNLTSVNGMVYNITPWYNPQTHQLQDKIVLRMRV